MKAASPSLIQSYFPAPAAEKILNLKSVLVSLSGGVDSSVILALLAGVMPQGGLRALIFKSFLHYGNERERALEMCRLFRVAVQVVEGPEQRDEGCMWNVPDRCARCKTLRVRILEREAQRLNAVVVDGTNADDVKDPTRLGNKVLAQCKNLFSPFAEGGLTKEQVRKLGAELEIPWAYEPATACLATRFPSGYPLTRGECQRAAAAETALRDAGFKVRVRIYGDTICLESLERDCGVLSAGRDKILPLLKGLGFERVMADLEGYKSGRSWLPRRSTPDDTLKGGNSTCPTK